MNTANGASVGASTGGMRNANCASASCSATELWKNPNGLTMTSVVSQKEIQAWLRAPVRPPRTT
ncbi:hypothetical protein RBA41_04650 [Massilia sp. CCM 9210]|uniref:hypothetical protein n=1 Tax=Massilia scottii TaxID=3057166 RepID=UPI0027969A34|nr:hypothetical protein [Massilia sp. CCM 9210]MDQ1812588.1 hypothetical protein [Massilia sp. CCM 9210]